MRHNKVALVAISIMLIALVPLTQQNAYAFHLSEHCSEGETAFKVPPVVTSIVPTLDGAEIEWTQAELDGDFLFIFHIVCALPEFFEVELQDPETLLDDTIVGGDSGEYIITGLECETTYIFDVDGLWATDLFGDKHQDGDDHEFTTLDCPTKKNGNCTNCQQPSIGVDERGIRVVDGGITVNGRTVDADFYHTPFPLIQSDIGQPVDFVLKIWDDRKDNIKHVQLQLGKGKIGESFTQTGSVTWDRDVMTGEATVTHDSMFKNVIMERLPDQPCKTGGVECTVIHARITPTQAIVGDVVFGVNIWDDGKNTVTSFFNDGVQIGTESDVIPEIPFVTPQGKGNKPIQFDDNPHIDSRWSEAFQQKLVDHTKQMEQLVTSMGY